MDIQAKVNKKPLIKFIILKATTASHTFGARTYTYVKLVTEHRWHSRPRGNSVNEAQ